MNAEDRKQLEQLPQQDILAIANSLHAIAKAQVAAGHKPTPQEQEALDLAAQHLPRLNRQ